MKANECCGGRCRWCDERKEPRTKWCERCRATVYVDSRGACLSHAGANGEPRFDSATRHERKLHVQKDNTHMSNLFETECNAKPVSAALEKRNGKWKVRVEFELVDGEHKGKRVPWDGKLDDSNIKWTKRNLATLGWQGKTSATIEADVMKEPKTVRVKTRIARFTRDDGSVSEWTAVDRIFGGAAKPSEPVTNDEIAMVDQWFASADEGGPAPADDDRIPF